MYACIEGGGFGERKGSQDDCIASLKTLKLGNVVYDMGQWHASVTDGVFARFWLKIMIIPA